VIRNVGILSMLSPDVERGTVVVRGDKISYVGGDTGMPDVPGARIVDGTGRYLIPGLIDLHTHVSKTRASALGLLVAHGVTTVRDLGGDHDELLGWKEEVKLGKRIGPRLLIAGPYLESARNAARQHGTPAFFTRLSKAGVMVVPTLVVLERLGSPDDGALKASVEAVDRPPGGRRLLSAYLRADWLEQLAEQGADRRGVYAALHGSARRDLAGMRAAGVRILAGTDIGGLNVFPGRAIHEELALMVRDVGLTPLEALQAATLHAAAGLGLERELGSIEAGNAQ
jgi:imidazolonepropionase-like amidohydrolase